MSCYRDPCHFTAINPAGLGGSSPLLSHQSEDTAPHAQSRSAAPRDLGRRRHQFFPLSCLCQDFASSFPWAGRCEWFEDRPAWGALLPTSRDCGRFLLSLGPDRSWGVPVNNWGTCSGEAEQEEETEGAIELRNNVAASWAILKRNRVLGFWCEFAFSPCVMSCFWKSPDPKSVAGLAIKH